MSSLVSFGSNGLKKLSPDPTGPGGIGINQNFEAIETALQARAASTHNHAASEITSGTFSTDRLPSGIDSIKIGAGLVSNTEFGYLDGVTSAIQTQLNSKASSTHTHNAEDITGGTLANARTTGTHLATPNALVLRDASGDCSVGVLGASEVSATDVTCVTLSADSGAFTSGITALGADLTTISTQSINAAAITSADGSAISLLNASNLASGTVPDGRFPATLPAVSGINLTALNASNIASGTLSTARLPTGIDAANLADGTISNAEFQYLNGVSSGIQGQLDNKQPLDSDLTSIAALTTTSFGRGLLELVDAAAGRTAFGLGTAAVVNTGTSGATIPLLNAANTFGPGHIIIEDTTSGAYTDILRINAASTTSNVLTMYSGGSRNFTLGGNGEFVCTGVYLRGAGTSGSTGIYFTQTVGQLRSGYTLSWTNDSGSAQGGSTDVGLARNAAGILRVTNGSSGNGSLLVGSQAVGNISLTVRAISSQTASLQVWQNSSSTTLLQVTKDGYVTTPNGVDSNSSDGTAALSMTITAGNGGNGLSGGAMLDKAGGDAGNISITAGTGGDGAGDDLGDANAGNGGSITLQAGIGGTPAGAGTYTDGEVVVNESGLRTNFRVESDTQTHCLFVDGINNRVGILNSSPSTALTVTGTVTATLFSGSGASLTSIPNTSITGLGTSSTVNTGTSGATIPLLNGANTWSASQIITASSSSAIPLILRGASGQSANLVEFQDNSSNVMARLDDDGSFYIWTTNSTTSSPRKFGMFGLSTGEAARWIFGDDMNSIQCGNGKKLQIAGYTGIELIGAYYGYWPTFSPPTFANDDNIAVKIPMVDTAKVGLVVQGVASQTVDTFQCRDSSGNHVFGVEKGGATKFTELSSTPADPTSGTETKIYMKADKLVIQYNHGGTVKYRYLDLTGTDGLWTYTTTAP